MLYFTSICALFPLLAFTAVIPLDPASTAVLAERSVDEAPGAAEDVDTHIYDGRVDFQLVRPDTDESLSFIFEVTPPSTPVPCGNSALYLNGQPLVQDWGSQDSTTSLGYQAAHGDFVDVPAASSLTGQVRALRVNSSSYCLPWHSGTEQDQTEHVVELTAVDILRVGDEDSVASFTVLFDQARRQILGVKRNTKDPILRIEWASSLLQQSLASLSSTPVTDELTDPKDGSARDSLSLEQEIALLQDLLWDLESLKSTIKDQRLRIHLLNIEESKKFKNRLSQCQSVGCYFREIVSKIKRCMHMLLLRFKGKHTTKPSQLHCLAPSPFAQAKVLMTGRPICGESPKKDEPTPFRTQKIVPPSEKTSTKAGKGPSIEEGHEDAPPPQYSEHEQPRPPIDDESRRVYDAETRLHTFLFAISSFFCLGCVAVAVHRRCMSPRSRAEWRARCEERRTAREYRQLARRQAMHNWLSRLTPRAFWKRDQRRMYDYEEKRNLIVSQETLLEEVMQSEIRRLTTNAAHAAEQGQGQPPISQIHVQHQQTTNMSRSNTLGGAETLPSYRSRSYSGRPPSYRSVDPNPLVDVADGFSDYAPRDTPSRAGSSSPVSEIAPPSDVTPDSSVREISPRQSSETLRTE